MSNARGPDASARWEWWRWILLILLPLLAYARLATAGFIWDDDTTLTANPLVAAKDGLGRIWLTTQANDYWPVTYSFLWGESRVWGGWAPGYHLVSVLLQVIAGLALWRLLLRLKLPGAYWAAVWFAVHPLNVESVAWIAQQKSLLAMVFFLLSLRLFAESAVIASGKPDRWCLLAWAAFLLSVLSKGSTAPLPFVLMGWVLWRRRLRWKDAIWLGGFFLTAAVLVLANIWFAHKSGGAVIRPVGWPERLAGAGGAFWFYLGKVFWPVSLCFVYPHWTVPPPHPIWWLGLGLALAVTVALWRGRGRGTGPELWAWLYFGVMLLPVLGFTDVYFMRYSLVADHYAYLALAGMAAWAGARFVQGRLPTVLAALLALLLAVLTFHRTGVYHDNFTLFRSVIARNPESGMAHNNLGKALLDLHSPAHLPEAVREFRESLRLLPDLADAHDNLGSALDSEGKTAAAIEQYLLALRLQPGLAAAHYNLGNAWLKTPGKLAGAIAEYQAALRLAPDYAEAHANLGNAWMKMPGKSREAIAQYQEALRLKPDNAETHYDLGNAWLETPGKLSDAIREYQQALRLEPGLADAHNNLGNAWAKMPGRLGEAIGEYEAALRLKPDYAEAHLNLAAALLRVPGRGNEAKPHLEEFLRLRPGSDAALQVRTALQKLNTGSSGRP